MSLTVDVMADSAFAKLVQDALVRICGCQSVAVDVVSGKVSIGPMSCACYCDHLAGCNLLTDLVGDARPITIILSENSSGYSSDKVWWYTRDVNFGDFDVCGGKIFPAWTQLAHELVHARHVSFDEDEAVRGENQIRMEQCLPMRKDYASTTVPDFRVGVLDASNRPEYGCSCFWLRGGLWAWIKRWLCILHSMYCFPRKMNLKTILRSLRGPHG